MNVEQAQTILEVLTGSIEREATATRKVISAITNPAYKPDAKSRSAMELAIHMATSDVWFADSIASGAFVWTGEPASPPEMTSPAAVARWHEQHLAERLAKLRALAPGDLVREVDFFGTKAPAVTWLVLMNNHAIHHRGQLAAYLRPMGSKVPAIYGMSADEPMPSVS